jgi:hypothetical protein
MPARRPVRYADEPPPGPAPVEAERPDLDEVRLWIDVAATDLEDEQLARIYWAEVGLQVAYNDTDPYTDWLALALLRRCARAAAARGLPLGTLPVQMTGYPDAYGALIIPRLDAEIERYEGPSRIIAFA